MLKKSITYKNFNDEEETEDFYFNLTKAELTEMQLSVPGEGGLKERLETITKAPEANGKEIIAVLKDIVLGSYGHRSPDGKRFVKNQQIRDEFESSLAYSEFFMKMVTDAEFAAEFINGIMPKDLLDDVNQTKLDLEQKTAEALGTNPPDEPRRLTEADVREMDADEFKSGLATGKYIYP